MTSNYYLPVLPPLSAQRPPHPTERHIHRRVNANGTISQMEIGSDGAGRTLDSPAPNMFDLFGKRGLQPGEANPSQQQPEQSELLQQLQQQAQAHLDKPVAKAEEQKPEADQFEKTAETLLEDKKEDRLVEEQRQPSAPEAKFEATPQSTVLVEAQASTGEPADTQGDAHDLQQLVSQLTVRLSVQDSTAEVSLDKLIDGFPSTVVSMRQVGAELKVTCRCESDAESEWFAEHGDELTRLLSERLRRKVHFTAEDGPGSRDTAYTSQDGNDANA